MVNSPVFIAGRCCSSKSGRFRVMNIISSYFTLLPAPSNPYEREGSG